MSQRNLSSPFDETTIRSLHVGDIVTITGRVFGMRDKTLIHMFDERHKSPVDLKGYPILHTAPSLKKVGRRWEKIIIGTTTSTRMNRFTPLLLEQYGVRAIIGKSGLYQDSLDAMKRFSACYLAIVGGAAALETVQIEDVEKVYWPELHPEAIYQFRVKELGPLIVAMDSYGRSLYDEVRLSVRRQLPCVYQKLGIANESLPG
ncbi:MAG: fumarate hydratase C-terminal domain-containing protein [Sedimentisphaerales bacterium]|nr:fumarate hydratase C-terminal domain-containing protein [Sedimentisphaerales bacterium]